MKPHEAEQNEEEKIEEDPYQEEFYTIYPEDELPSEVKPPTLAFRFVHFFGMAVVAALILGGVWYANGGSSSSAGFGAKGSPGSANSASITPQTIKAATEGAQPIRYTSEIALASEDLKGALAEMNSLINAYVAAPNLRKDTAWRNNAASSLDAAIHTASRLIKLSNPPLELISVNARFQSAGRELDASVRDFALAADTGEMQYVKAAEQHRAKCKNIADLAERDYLVYRQATGN